MEIGSIKTAVFPHYSPGELCSMQLIIHTTTLEMWTYFWTARMIPIWVGSHLFQVSHHAL
jgi:hypothetical protein